jgi:ribosomal protein S18 acetylase RimI-like enzyme
VFSAVQIVGGVELKSDRERTARGARPAKPGASATALPKGEDVHLERLDLARGEIALAVLELQRRAYQLEADLIGSDEIPPLHESLDELQTSGETFLGGFVGGTLVGAISWRVKDGLLDLHRLVVDPSHVRAGIGSALVRAALAAEPEAERAIVQTGAANEPAKRLYCREGFEEIDDIEVAPGLRVTRFARQLPR